ncbi:MAG: PEP-CTERM sorting domain-containing protein [Phycisphaerales bacterium]
MPGFIRPMRGLAVVAGLAAALLVQVSVADAAMVSGDMNEYTGSDMIGRAVFEQVGNDIKVTLTTVQEPGHTNTGDWGGFWFNISDDSFLAGMTVVGADITAFDFSGGVGSVGSANNNLNGGGSPGAMDAGIAFGEPGASSGLLSTTTFTLSHPSGLTLSLFENQTIAGRLQTVGPVPNGGGGSSKITGNLNVPEPASLALIGIGSLLIAKRRAN